MAFVTLRVLHGADRGKVFERLSTPVSVGREEGNTIQLNDERISRYHLKLQEDEDKVILTDLESTNGTKVNGEDVQVRIVRHGDMIALGRSLLLFGSRTEIDQRIAEVASRHASMNDDHARQISERIERVQHGAISIEDPDAMRSDAFGLMALTQRTADTGRLEREVAAAVNAYRNRLEQRAQQGRP